MRTPVPELDERYSCSEDAIEHLIHICTVIVNKAKKVYPTPSISDMPGYVLEFCCKVLRQTTTLNRVAREREDYNTLCSLVRMLADSIATINLVYCAKDDEERIIRHLLYVLDGVSARYKMLDGRPVEYNGTIPRETYEALCAQVQGAKDNAVKCIEYCVTTIRKSPVYSIKKDAFELLIHNKNWKFKTVDKPKSRDAYTWKEMYGMTGVKLADEMFPFLSQYVHGLSVSNIAIDDKDDFDAPLSFAYCLLYWLFEFLRRLYEPQIEEYTMEDIRKMVPELFQQV